MQETLVWESLASPRVPGVGPSCVRTKLGLDRRMDAAVGPAELLPALQPAALSLVLNAQKSC